MMKSTINYRFKTLFYCSVLLLFLSACSDNTPAQPEVVIQPELTVLQKLEQLPGTSVEKRQSPIVGYEYYYLRIEQPLDHHSTGTDAFAQHVRILLKDTDSPVILRTNGYGLSSEQRLSPMELTSMLSANQVEIEHRYFGESTTQIPDWQYLTIKQAAADHNRVIELLKPILSGQWIATGKSKGGMAATYLQRFYPDSIAGVVAYVAPLSFDMWDERFAQYSLSVVNPQCAEKYMQYQRQALLRLDELETIIGDWASQNNFSTSSNGYDLNARLQAEIALSWIEVGSGFNDLNCDAIPSPTDETLAYADFMYQGSQFMFLVNEGLSLWLPYHMQAATELGNFSAPLSHLEDLLTFDVTDFQLNLLEHPMPQYDPQVMLDIHDWAKNQASNLIMIYGEQDIFTAGAYPIQTDTNRDTQLHIEPGLHGITIADLSEPARDNISQALNRWVQN